MTPVSRHGVIMQGWNRVWDRVEARRLIHEAAKCRASNRLWIRVHRQVKLLVFEQVRDKLKEEGR